jgi:aminoglycoside phosphotransferase (APT) family kinase protein
VPVPPIVFSDLEGEVLGEPLLVLEYLEGEVASRVPDPERLAQDVADAMAAIHRIDTTGWGLVAPGPLRAPPPEPGRPILERSHQVLAPHLCAFAPTALLHGDMWPGNLLVRDGRLVGILDWEDAHLGDPLIDIAIARLDLAWLYGEACAEAFVERMRAHRDIPTRELALADLYAALRPGSYLELWAEAYPKIGRPDVTAASMREVQDRFAERALDLL